MSEAKHTPFPWRAEKRDWCGQPSEHRVYISGDHSIVPADDDNPDSGEIDVATSVGIIEGNATSTETTAANAALILSIPLLLAFAECDAAWNNSNDELELYDVLEGHGYAGGASAPAMLEWLVDLRTRALAAAKGGAPC